MQSVMIDHRQLLPSVLTELLPPELCEEVELATPFGAFPEELRLCRGRCATLSADGRVLRLSYILDSQSAEALLSALCGGSLYAHEETMKEGYLSLGGGVRVGLAGRAAVEHGRVIGVCDISTFVFRIPHISPPVGGEICGLLRQFAGAGVLLYAPPGVGKTTLLRGVMAQMAGGENPWRVVAVDTREELGALPGAPDLTLDILSGYPKGIGISVAVRTLGAKLVVCDEIGGRNEAEEILRAHRGGVALLASAHAGSLAELLARPDIRTLHESRCFGAYVGVKRGPERFSYVYDIRMWEAANDLF